MSHLYLVTLVANMNRDYTLYKCNLEQCSGDWYFWEKYSSIFPSVELKQQHIVRNVGWLTK